MEYRRYVIYYMQIRYQTYGLLRIIGSGWVGLGRVIVLPELLRKQTP